MKYPALIFFLFLCLCLPARAADLPRLGTDGNRFVTSDGKTAHLRGVSLCSLEWHNPLQQMEQVTSSPDKWAVNILRLPVQVKEWDRVGAQAYLQNYLDPAVKMCRDKGVYCIIDWHEIARWDDAKIQSKLENFWKHVAPRYAADKNIIYEIFNEPTEPKAKTKENWMAWRAKAQMWVDSIRRDAPQTLLLVGSPHWSQMPAFAVDAPFSGKNIGYVLHLYPNYDAKEWDGLFGKAAEHIPLILTEWGWSASKKAKGQIFFGSQASFGEPLKSYLEERPQIGWTAWSYDPLCGPAMLGEDKDMGAFVKDWLRASAAGQ